MTFENFKEMLKNDITSALDAKGLEYEELHFAESEKYNKKYDAMLVSLKGSSNEVNIDIDEYYVLYRLDCSYGKMLAEIVDIIARALEQAENFSTKQLEDYNFIKDRLFIEALSAENEYLNIVPHMLFEDIAIIYRCVISDEMSIVITNELFDIYGISIEQLHKDAVKSSMKHNPMIIRDMPYLNMGGLMKIVTVQNFKNGTGTIAYTDFFDRISAVFGGSSNFYLLPSSVHEYIAVKDIDDLEPDELKKMVTDINKTEVAPEDKLTDSVYYYDISKKKFSKIR